MSMISLLLLASAVTQTSTPAPADISELEADVEESISKEESAAYGELLAAPYERLTEMMSWGVCLQDDFTRSAGQGLALLNECQVAATKRLLSAKQSFEANATPEEQQAMATQPTLATNWALINRCMNSLDDFLRETLPSESDAKKGGDSDVDAYCSPYVLYGIAGT